jgi:predicted RNA binding protein YcfA (HicA-like mRNA interferase family)
VKVRDVIRMLEEDGWQLVRTRGSLDVPVGTLGSILKQAGLKRD